MNVTNEHRRYHLAVWTVIASEALLFAGLFALYWSYRAEYPAQFDAGIAHDLSWDGALNTLLLLTSSFAIAWSILMTREGRRTAATISLVVTLVLGAGFLFFKFYEWHEHVGEGLVPGVSLFFTLYYLMTGLHAFHVVAGMCLVLWVTVRRQRGLALELVALYWHFVDVIWVFLWPMFYVAKP